MDLRDRSGVFASLMARTFSTVGIGDATKQTFAEIVSANYFTTLGVPLAVGRAFTPTKSGPAPGRRWRSRRSLCGATPASRPGSSAARSCEALRAE